MISLTFKNDEVTIKNLENYHYLPMYTLNSTIEFQASDVELDFIRNNFNNVPISSSRVCIWYGKTAKFIAVNLKLILQNSK